MTPAFKQWLPMRHEHPTTFDPKVWLQPRPHWIYGGDDVQEKMRRVRDQLTRELNLATDDQLRELGKGINFMGPVRAELVIGEAKRRGLV